METIWQIQEAKQFHRHSPGLAIAIGRLLPKSTPILDLGCGLGTYLAYLTTQGFSCRGIEGTQGITDIADFQKIETADLSRSLDIAWPRSSVLCLEVGEHLAEESEGQLLDNIDRYCDSWLVLSWAIPGQGGHGHINCRPNSHVYDQMTRRGFCLLARETFLLREAADETTAWFRNTLLVFRRCASL